MGVGVLSVCMPVCTPILYLVPVKAREGAMNPLEL